MKPQAWKRTIGKEAFEYLTSDLDITQLEEIGLEGIVAEVMTKLYEIGWRGQEHTPKIHPAGTRVLWPSKDGEGIPVLTSKGLEKYWTDRGHQWVLLRVAQLTRAMAGPLAPRLQEMLAAYEEQCEADEVVAIPPWADWQVFVGGEKPVIDADQLHKNLGGVGSDRK